jgi:hypothetical protein
VGRGEIDVRKFDKQVEKFRKPGIRAPLIVWLYRRDPPAEPLWTTSG